MSYRVLARAYRSATFDEVVGQEAATTTLRNAIKSGRVHHGYLFTGTRGVGKTSMARILAKSLNCLESPGPTVTPCCRCDSCVAIAAGEDVDVVEIDAASNTGVDNIRELRSNATLRPARARFKIYIIDEVHMLSTGAFNALLKTLEEPPPHVKFILATTEAHKVPATIQSRCQRFDFRAIDVDTIVGHLKEIAKKEKIKADEAVLRRVARLANGSMRDALSLMDMLLSWDATQLTLDVLNQVVPPPHDEMSMAVVDLIAEGDAGGALAALDAALQTGRTVDRFCDHLIEHIRTLMLIRVCGAETELIDVAAADRPALFTQAQRFDAPAFVYMIALLEELRRNVKFSGAARALADAAVVRLSMTGQFSQVTEVLDRLDSTSIAAASGPTPPPSRGPAPAAPSTPAAVDTSSKKKDLDRESVTVGHRGPVPVSSGPPTRGIGETAPGNPGPVPLGHAERSEASPGRDRPEEREILRFAQNDSRAGSGVRSTSTPTAPARPKASQADLQKIASDPFIQRVKDAVGGMVVDVRPAKAAIVPEPAAEPAEVALNQEASPVAEP